MVLPSEIKSIEELEKIYRGLPTSDLLRLFTFGPYAKEIKTLILEILKERGIIPKHSFE